MEFSLDCGLITEPIFCDIFSINKSQFDMEFSVTLLVLIKAHLKWNFSQNHFLPLF